ncbi:hypothetical protein OURE66S_01104 [Oligella ureolytica]
MKQIAITLIQEAVDAGARRHMACALMGISCRTLLRWQAAGQDLADKRRDTAKRVYAHALSEEERREILNVCNLPEHQSLPPTQIVPKLADKGIYIASESSRYLLKLDLLNFFNSITPELFWQEWKYFFEAPDSEEKKHIQNLLFWAPQRTLNSHLVLSIGALALQVSQTLLCIDLMSCFISIAKNSI